MSELGQKVRELRILRGITQQRLAEKAGVGHALIVALESGRRRYVSAQDVGRLAAGLEVPEGKLWSLIPGGQREDRYILIVGAEEAATAKSA